MHLLVSAGGKTRIQPQALRKRWKQAEHLCLRKVIRRGLPETRTRRYIVEGLVEIFWKIPFRKKFQSSFHGRLSIRNQTPKSSRQAKSRRPAQTPLKPKSYNRKQKNLHRLKSQRLLLYQNQRRKILPHHSLIFLPLLCMLKKFKPKNLLQLRQEPLWKHWRLRHLILLRRRKRSLMVWWKSSIRLTDQNGRALDLSKRMNLAVNILKSRQKKLRSGKIFQEYKSAFKVCR